MATTNLTDNVVGVDEKVKGSAGDPTPDFLDGKVDGATINVVANQLVRADLTGDVTTVGNAATVVGGNSTTVTTNADLTGIVTSTGNATAIADGAVPFAKLADGTDGELITWSAAGVIAAVPVGTAADVLTSGGVGVAPTFQAAAGGGGGIPENIESFTGSGTWTRPGDVDIVLVQVWAGGGGAGNTSGNSSGGGGGGGGYSQGLIDVSGNVTVTIGAGGSGGSGGTSSFAGDVTIQATGGAVGLNGNSGGGGAGGVGSVGDVNLSGGKGGDGCDTGASDEGGSGATGGGSPMGGAGGPGGSAEEPGTIGTLPGGGGGGRGAGTNGSGANGVGGLVIVSY
jgi:hypothetical protein